MTELIIQDTTLQGIADSIRSKTGRTASIPVPNMSSEIDTIPGVVTGTFTTGDSGLRIIQFTCPFKPSNLFIHLYYPEAAEHVIFYSNEMNTDNVTGRPIGELEYDGTHFYSTFRKANEIVGYGMLDRLYNGSWVKPSLTWSSSSKLVSINLSVSTDIIEYYSLLPNAAFRWVAVE